MTVMAAAADAVEPVLLADPRIASIPVADTGERLVRLRPALGVSVAASRPAPPLGLPAAGPDLAYAHVREGLAACLDRAAARLPRGLRLHVVEGYRSPNAQRAYFEAYRARLVTDHPRLTRAQSHGLASRFVAPPEVAAHPSGAAIDVTLVDRHGRPLDMGTEIDATPEKSGGACYFAGVAIDAAARAHRDILADSLRHAGLVNYPTEWWHWSYGDRYWAFVTGHTTALYGQVERLWAS